MLPQKYLTAAQLLQVSWPASKLDKLAQGTTTVGSLLAMFRTVQLATNEDQVSGEVSGELNPSITGACNFCRTMENTPALHAKYSIVHQTTLRPIWKNGKNSC